MRRYHKATLAGIILLAFALRLYRLDAQSIWVDEGISLHLAISSLAEIVADRAANIHPPLYFFLLKGWVALAGVNIYTARFSSVIASMLQVPVIYAVTRRWMGRPAAQIAASFTALSPLSIVYAQEIRAYALLPLVYLALLSITRTLTQESTSNRCTVWLLLGVAEVIGLHLHYTVLFLVAYIAAWAVLVFWREKRWTDLRRWAITQLLVGLACLPWLIAVLGHWADVQVEATAGTTLAQPSAPGYLLAQIWAFHLTGLTSALQDPAIKLATGLAFLIAAALLLLRLIHPATRRPTAQLTAHWLVPLDTALLAWIVRPYAPPRYITLYTPGLTLLLAYAIHPSSRITLHASRFTHHASRIVLTISLILLPLLGLRAYFFDPAFAKDDVRGVARYLEEASGPDDLILVPDGDWSLTFAYQGTAPVKMPGVDDVQSMWANLARWTTHRQRAFVINYRMGIGGDQRELVPFALEKAGTLHARQSFQALIVRQYQLDRPVEPPTLVPLEARFDSLTPIQAWAENKAPADTALTLALRWRLEQSTDQRCHLTIRLLDADGWPLAVHDTLLLDERLYPTDQWAAGQEATTFHILPIPPGVPPLTYTLTVGLYEQTESGPRPLDTLDDQGTPQGQWLSLGDVRLTPPLGLTNNPYNVTANPPPLPQPADLANGLQLLGAGLDRPTLRPGQSLFVILHWQATGSPLPALRPRLTLIQADQELSIVESAPALGRYPTDRWQTGETVIEHRRLTAPITTVDGPADVVLALGNRQLVLGQVEIDAEEHTFTRPPIAYPLDVQLGQVARLIGYDLPLESLEGVSSTEPITLTLYWQALEGAADADYTVFTHILAADGHMVGGHDSPPVSGARPTLAWLLGEIVTDPHAMTFREPYVGPARIEVGLYDPVTLERVPVDGGGTFILLPTTLTIPEQ